MKQNVLADACMCSHELDLPLGHVVQLVLFTNLPPLDCKYTSEDIYDNFLVPLLHLLIVISMSR